MAGLCHELVAVAAAFESAGFDAAGTMRHFALGDPGQLRETVVDNVLLRDAAARQIRPRSENILAVIYLTQLGQNQPRFCKASRITDTL